MFKLKFESDNTDFLIDINIDGISHQYEIIDNTIHIPHRLNIGFHLLEIEINSLSPLCQIKIIDAILDDCSVVHALYTMFGINSDHKKYQTTILNNQTKKIWLPFANPISHWISSCIDKIPYKYFSGGLYENFDVYYPESIQVADYFPKMIKDFFKINLDFYIHEKTHDVYLNRKIPYAFLQNIQYNELELYRELNDNLDYLISHGRSPSQITYEAIENGQQKLWSLVDFIAVADDDYDVESKFLLDKNRVPNIFQLIKNLNLEKIVHGFIGILPPGSYILPHRDQYDFDRYHYIYEKFGGCSQIYIPINFKPGNFFKMANIGVIPLDGPMLINNHEFVHSLVNGSDEYRFALAFVGSEYKN